MSPVFVDTVYLLASINPSFVVMEDMGIEQALTADAHFVQAGFRALMLE